MPQSVPYHPYDWNNDGCSDILVRAGTQGVWLFTQDHDFQTQACSKKFTYANQLLDVVQFAAYLLPGDWDNDGCPDIITETGEGDLYLFYGDCDEGFKNLGLPKIIGSGFDIFDFLIAPGDFDFDACRDLIGRRASDQTLQLYTGDCSTGGAFKAGPIQIGSGWGGFDWFFGPGYWNADICTDLIGRRTDDATLRFYGGACNAGFASNETDIQIGSGWDTFKYLAAGGDWDSDNCPDIIAQRADDFTAHLYSGDCNRGFGTYQDYPLSYVGGPVIGEAARVAVTTPTPTPTAAPSPTSTQTATPTLTPTVTPPVVLKGDATCDGVINTADLGRMLAGQAGKAPSPNADCDPDLDLNCDDHVDEKDIIVFLWAEADLNWPLPSNCPAIGTQVT